MMNISRDVILDLLPLYLADEVSEDTRTLVEKYLETDPELAEIAEQQRTMGLPGEVPIPLTEEDEMKAYKKTRWITVLYIVALAALMSCIGVALLVAFLLPSSAG